MAVLVKYDGAIPPISINGHIGNQNPGIVVRQAQSFIVPSLSIATDAMLYLSANTENDLSQIRIETDSGGKPSGTLADTNLLVDLPLASLPASYGWVTVTFPGGGGMLSANTSYWLVDKRKTESGSFPNFHLWGGGTTTEYPPGYADGQQVSFAVGSWLTPSSTVDLNFQILGTVNMATTSVHQKVIQKIIAMLAATSDVTSSVPSTNIYLGHISTIRDTVFPAISFHIMPGLGKSTTDGGLQRINIQMDLWFQARGKNSYTWDDVFTCYQAVLNAIHRNGGNDASIGVKIIEITNVQEGPMMWEEDVSLMHWPSKFRIMANV